jgi:hypothetical protein
VDLVRVCLALVRTEYHRTICFIRQGTPIESGCPNSFMCTPPRSIPFVRRTSYCKMTVMPFRLSGGSNFVESA